MDRLIETHNSMLKDLVLMNWLQIVMGILFNDFFCEWKDNLYIEHKIQTTNDTEAALINFDESKALLHGGCLIGN